jgi:predicted O-methyltransferase YrrM
MPIHTTDHIQAQLNPAERGILVDYLLKSESPPSVTVEVGTWLGGGSTLHILRELVRLGNGHLYGIEADASIYQAMVANIRKAIPDGLDRFTPLFGFSQVVLPKWIQEQGHGLTIDFVFLDGGDSPGEQITEFQLLDPYIPVGGRLLSHDAKLRKGKWLVPYLSALDNYQTTVHDVSVEGLLTAVKIAAAPSESSKQAAAAVLRRCRRSPIEFLGRLTPRWVLRVAAAILPRALVLKLAAGR